MARSDFITVRVTLDSMQLNMVQMVDAEFDRDAIKAAIKRAVDAFDMDAEAAKMVRQHAAEVALNLIRKEVASKIKEDDIAQAVRAHLSKKIAQDATLSVLEREHREAQERQDWDSSARLEKEIYRARHS